MDIIKSFRTFLDFIQGFLEVANIDTHRYCFVVNKLEVVYENAHIKTKISYMPVGCHRPFHNYVSELNDEVICRKFKPDHARMIIGIDSLEKTLNFNCQNQIQVYLDFVTKCMNKIRSFNEK